MASINEIMNRDHRTTRPQTVSPIKTDKIVDCTLATSSHSDFDAFYNCDKCQNKYQSMKSSNLEDRPLRLKNLHWKKFSNYVLIIAISIYIMSSNSAQANPIPRKTSGSTSVGKDEVDKINFMNLQCSNVDGHRILSNTPLSTDVLLERLKAVVISCNSALHQTKGLTDNYIKQLWGHEVTVSNHHTTWEHKNVPWLWPDNKPLQHKFRGDFHKEHFNELVATDWTADKIFEYLGKIYQRFQRIGVGVQIVNKWNELASMDGTTLLNPEQVNVSSKLFKNATEGIHEVLCSIQAIFYDMAIDPRTDLDITPFILDKFIKLNHWLVYREYENLMDYSHKLLKIITDDKKHPRKHN